ncbi:hypothetical protein MPTK2_4g20680 [Marchantia polymorpha subsp. ruderalis]
MNCVRAAEKVSDCTEDGGPSNLTISSNSPEARSSARKESRRRGVSCRCSDRQRERETARRNWCSTRSRSEHKSRAVHYDSHSCRLCRGGCLRRLLVGS